MPALPVIVPVPLAAQVPPPGCRRPCTLNCQYPIFTLAAPTCLFGCPGPAVSCPAPPPPASGRPAQTPARQPPCTWPRAHKTGVGSRAGRKAGVARQAQSWNAKIGTCLRLITSRTRARRIGVCAPQQQLLQQSAALCVGAPPQASQIPPDLAPPCPCRLPPPPVRLTHHTTS